MDVRRVLSPADCLIIVPPFAGLSRPSLAAHTLQACAAARGSSVAVLYAGMLLASEIGEDTYEAICYAATSTLLGERLFARLAYGTRALGRDTPEIVATNIGSSVLDLTEERVRAVEAGLDSFVEGLADAIVGMGYRVVGCSTTFEQTAASVALLDRVKTMRPETICILGGANCEGEMANGIASLGSKADFIFSGESEDTFPAFLEDTAAGRRPDQRIILGSPCNDLDAIPPVRYDEYFSQRDAFLPSSVFASTESVWLPYEGSRGCWWGQKHHCTFCGINGTGLSFRRRSADRIVDDVRRLTQEHGIKRVCMTDNIMPHEFHQTLIPRLKNELPGLHMFYEQKANLTLRQVSALAEAGVKVIQPGIEALSSELLRRMDKGVTARQNIALLRYARSAHVGLNWNILYGFAGDGVQAYRSTVELMPFLHHLEPPSGPYRLSIDRFSPYFFAAERYGIHNLRPMAGYAAVLPERADPENVAYHFVGDYDSGILRDAQLLGELESAIAAWRALWNGDGDPPMLQLIALDSDQFLVLDTRGLPGGSPVQFIDVERAGAALCARPLSRDDRACQWARAHGLAVAYEDWHVPLAVASLPIFEQFQLRPLEGAAA